MRANEGAEVTRPFPLSNSGNGNRASFLRFVNRDERSEIDCCRVFGPGRDAHH